MADSTTSSTSLNHPTTTSSDQQLVVVAVEDHGNREGDSATATTTTPPQVAAEDHGTEHSTLLVPDATIAINPPAETGDNQLSAVEEIDDAVEISELRKTFKSHMIVAALIATVTFAAAFTLPGGYVQSGGNGSGEQQVEGMAVLWLPPNGTHHTDDPMIMRNGFLVFVWADSAALVFSLSAVLFYFLAAFPIKRAKRLRAALLCGYYLTMFAVLAMVTAFVTGLQAVLPGYLALYIFIIVTFFLSCVVPTSVVFNL